jgi:hypothetical protein
MMVIKIDGVEISQAVIKTEQMELRVLEVGDDRMTFEVQDVYGESFNFVPRFFRFVYSGGSTVAATDQETRVVQAGETIESTVVFERALRLEARMKIEMRYGMSRLADVTVE